MLVWWNKFWSITRYSTVLYPDSSQPAAVASRQAQKHRTMRFAQDTASHQFVNCGTLDHIKHGAVLQISKFELGTFYFQISYLVLSSLALSHDRQPIDGTVASETMQRAAAVGRKAKVDGISKTGLKYPKKSAFVLGAGRHQRRDD